MFVFYLCAILHYLCITHAFYWQNYHWQNYH
ncbi:hypothetical protein CYJ66_05535 [Gardnerella vaginalis]|nr:hypothetical protein CYJ66_05535 [Gardnerella vaginalis]PKZ56536.1 hypothetical protein CYJ64_05535 [Gardnerella vaginalis]PKZ57929.1 hypothetical protein CYJ63_01960 [Gardnerella vaginalis]PKZ74987.1 hypothetical protein CYJ65_05910 [Gardnerella vaginalis]